MPDILQIALSNAALVTAVAPIVWGMARVVRQPALTHLLWVILLLKLLTPPLFVIPVHFSHSLPGGPIPTERSEHLAASSPESHSAALPARSDLHQGSVTSPDPESPFSPGLEPFVFRRRLGELLLSLVDVVWISGSMICLGIAVIRVMRFLRMLRHATYGMADEQRRVNELAVRLNLAKAPSLWFIRGTLCPMLWTVGRSAGLLMPNELWERLEPVQRDAIVVHELAHWRRRDHRVRWLELIATSLFWWNPTVWWARHELREAEEQCCDAWVLWVLGDFRNYADALLKAVEFVSIRAERSFSPSAVPALASGMGQFAHLKRRITMLKDGKVARALSWSGIAAAFTLGAMLLPMSPSLAQVVSTKQGSLENAAREAPLGSQTDSSTTTDEPVRESPTSSERQLRDAKREIEQLSHRLQEAEARLEVLRATSTKRFFAY